MDIKQTVMKQTVLAATESFTVLLIEDNLGDVRLVQELFREVSGLTFQLLVAETLAAAIARLTTEPISIILLDLSLPDADGLDSLRQIQQIAPDLPVVVMSGLQDDAVAIKAVQLGAQDYLIKGQLDSPLLARSLRYAVERQRMQTSLKQAQADMQQLYQQVQALNTNLEAQVEERTQQLGREKTLLEATLNSLNASEAKFRSIFESTAVAISLTNLQGYILECNPVFEQVVGYSLAELRQKNFADYTYPDDLEADLILFRQLVRGEIDSYHIEKRILQRNGYYLWISLSVSLVRDSTGQPWYELAVIENIHERKQSEQLLVGQKQILEMIARGAELSTVLESTCKVVEAQFHRIFCSVLLLNEADQTLRYGSIPSLPKTYLPTNVAIPVGPNVGCCGAVAYSGCPVLVADIDTAPSWNDYRQLALDHGLRACWSFPILSQQGPDKVLGTFAMYCQDSRYPSNRERDLAELFAQIVGIAIEREQAYLDLKQSETRFRALVRNAMDGIAVLDANGIILYESPSIEQRLGYRPEEVIGKSGFELLHPDDLERTISAFQTSLLQPGVAIKLQYRCQHKDGSWRYIESVGTNLLHDPSVNGIVMNARDITERIHYEVDLQVARDEAEAGSRAKSDFLAMMSHELRTPLNAVLGLSELLRQEIFGPLNLKQREYMTCIHSSGEHLLSLINDILDLSKVEAGKEELIYTPVGISDLCTYCLSIVRERAIEAGLKLTLQLDLETHTCFADERRLRQMLLNLLSNAIKFTPEGEVVLTVTEQADWILFTVTDTGIGIAPEHLNTIFEPFRQVDSSLDRQFDGTGLGLTLTNRLAQLHGGNVTVVSHLGEGSEFRLHLPKTTPPQWYGQHYPHQVTPVGERATIRNLPNQKPFLETEPPLVGKSTSGALTTKKTVLIIERDTRSALLLQDYLQALNYQVHYLAEATSLVDNPAHPHLIILGIHRSQEQMDRQILAQIRQHPALASTPVIVITAMAMSGDRERLLAAGADAYLSKPILMSQLEEILAQLSHS